MYTIQNSFTAIFIVQNHSFTGFLSSPHPHRRCDAQLRDTQRTSTSFYRCRHWSCPLSIGRPFCHRRSPYEVLSCFKYEMGYYYVTKKFSILFEAISALLIQPLLNQPLTPHEPQKECIASKQCPTGQKSSNHGRPWSWPLPHHPTVALILHYLISTVFLTIIHDHCSADSAVYTRQRQCRRYIYNWRPSILSFSFPIESYKTLASKSIVVPPTTKRRMQRRISTTAAVGIAKLSINNKHSK